MNRSKLRSKMALHDDTGGILARAIGISESRLSAKINETNGAEFTQKEIEAIKKRYDLSPEEIDEIFFEKKVS